MPWCQSAIKTRLYLLFLQIALYLLDLFHHCLTAEEIVDQAHRRQEGILSAIGVVLQLEVPGTSYVKVLVCGHACWLYMPQVCRREIGGREPESCAMDGHHQTIGLLIAFYGESLLWKLARANYSKEFGHFLGEALRIVLLLTRAATLFPRRGASSPDSWLVVC